MNTPQRSVAELNALIEKAEKQAARNRERQRLWYERHAEEKRAYAKDYYQKRKAAAGTPALMVEELQ